jgi:hypothetical protein
MAYWNSSGYLGNSNSQSGNTLVHFIMLGFFFYIFMHLCVYVLMKGCLDRIVNLFSICPHLGHEPKVKVLTHFGVPTFFFFFFIRSWGICPWFLQPLCVTRLTFNIIEDNKVIHLKTCTQIHWDKPP